jgi:hypothetical protein
MLTRRNIVLTALAVAVLMAVFAMYTQPDFLVQMTNQLWSCF